MFLCCDHPEGPYVLLDIFYSNFEVVLQPGCLLFDAGTVLVLQKMKGLGNSKTSNTALGVNLACVMNSLVSRIKISKLRPVEIQL